MSTVRKQLVGFSLAAAAWVAFMLVLGFTGALEEIVEDEVMAMAVGLAVMVPTILGLALSFGSLSSRAGNPIIVWVAIAWNVLQTAVFLLLCVIGVMMGI